MLVGIKREYVRLAYPALRSPKNRAGSLMVLCSFLIQFTLVHTFVKKAWYNKNKKVCKILAF